MKINGRSIKTLNSLESHGITQIGTEQTKKECRFHEVVDFFFLNKKNYFIIILLTYRSCKVEMLLLTIKNQQQKLSFLLKGSSRQKSAYDH